VQQSSSIPAKRKPLDFERYGLLLAWAVLILIFGVLEPTTFLTAGNISTMLGSQAVLVIVALGLTVSLTVGEFDLSIANVLVSTSMVTALLNVNAGWPIALAVLGGLLVGVVVGFINGLFIVKLRINSLIVTLGVGSVLQGLTSWISQSTTVSGVDQALVQNIIVRRIAGVPLAFYYAVLLCVVLWYLFQHTALGRRLLFVGRSGEVAQLSGIRVDRIRWGSMLTSSLFGSVAGIIYTGTRGAADPTSGLSFMLPAFAAAFLGATSIYPGRFNPIGSVVAVYFLVTGITGLLLFGVPTFVQDLFYGGALLVAVAVSQWLRSRVQRPGSGTSSGKATK